MQHDVNKLIDAIYSNLQIQKPLDELTLLEFRYVLAKIITTHPFSRQNSYKYDELSYLDSFTSIQYAKESIEQLDPERAFELGAVYGMCKLFSQIVATEEEQEYSQFRKATIERFQKLLKIVKDRPGISQTDLAEKYEVSEDELLQLLNNLEFCKLFLISRNGTEKYYYLSTYALQALDAIVK